MIANEPDMRVVGEAADGTAAVELYAVHHPDVVLMDLRMPKMDGVSAIRAIRAADPEAESSRSLPTKATRTSIEP